MYSRDAVRSRIMLILDKYNLSQAEFSRRIGVSEVAVSKYVSGEISPGAEVVASICEEFNISADWFLLGRR